jgi:hypothetical protein
VGHTVTFDEELGGSLWTDESWLDTKHEWIDVAELDFIVTPVETIERDINVESLRGWVLWVDGSDLTAREVSLYNNSITVLVGESNLDMRAVISWAGKILTFDVESGSFRVLGYTIGWVDRGDSWTIVESKISTNVLPVLIVMLDFNHGVTSIF